MTNTLLPARMFLVCSTLINGNGFVGSSDYETSSQDEGDVRAKAKSKYHFFSGFYYAELEAVCSGM
ncbi:hypothetical protein [Lutibacter citreus]|uniref:hypothetical protein n=1 Tax=Lutibacter citreus TaxID=2138210 RepID=UPI0013001E3E|nr:hypothetical protein [Lutibacter citreus]